MNRFFDYSDDVQAYFDAVDKRFCVGSEALETADLEPKVSHLPNVKAVMWDLYGTLLGIGIGDLEGVLEDNGHITRAAELTIDEFGLAAAMERLAAKETVNLGTSQMLRKMYMEQIAQSHEKSKKKGIEYPEVVIERIWAEILTKCNEADAGLLERLQGKGRRIRDISLRCAYFFDSAMQQTTFNANAAQCLKTLADSGISQGIISNAQFYTPIHLRRLSRKAGLGNEPFNTVFTMPLLFFSYELGYSKPNAGAFAAAQAQLDKMAISAENIVYVGNDMLNDVWAAKQAGWHTILYAGQKNQTRLRSNDERCVDLSPDCVVLDLMDVARAVLGDSDGG